MAGPKVIDTVDGKGAVLVETPLTKRSQELWQMYNALILPTMAREQREDLLSNIKETTAVSSIFTIK